MGIGPTQLAKELGISRERVYQLERSGKIARTNGGFVVDDVRRQLKQNLDIRQPSVALGNKDTFVPPQVPTGSVPSLAAVQLQHEIARASRAQLELKRLKGELWPSTDVQEEWDHLVMATRSHLLLLPGKISHRLAVVADASECQKILDEAIKDALRTLSEFDLHAA